MKSITASLGIIALLASGLSLAGGDSWQVKVLRVTEKGGVSVVEISPIDRGAPWDGCAVATIKASYQPEPLGRRTWSENLATSSTQREAMRVLATAANAGAVVRFGSMGTGVVQRSSPKCAFESRGLALLEESDGRKQVYSFHGAT